MAWQDCVRKIKPERRAEFDEYRMFHYINSDNAKVKLSAREEVDYLLYQLCPNQVDDNERGS
jgi:hypothetical protein